MTRYFHLARATLWLLFTFGRAVLYFRWKAMLALDLPNGLVMTAQEQRRLKHYFYGTTYLAAVFGSLHNQAGSKHEKALFTKLSALAYCFDDLVDTVSDAPDKGIIWQDNPEDYGLVADQRGLALHLLHPIYARLSEKQLLLFKGYMHRVFNAETAGKQHIKRSDFEHETALNLDELKQITAEKGGASVLLFRSVLIHTLSNAEEKALSQFGHLIQLSDDIFDLWHDHQAGIETCATFLARKGEVSLMSRIFEEQVLATQLAFRHTSFPPIQVETTLQILHFLISITRVCLERYERLAEQNGLLPLHDRTLMVVDMEKWNNRFRAIFYLLHSDPPILKRKVCA